MTLPGFRSFYLIIALVFSLSTPQVGLGATNDTFNKGMTYFKEGKYQQAIQQFKKSEKQGLHNAAVYYNLGVSYFKLQQYKSAEYYFNKTRKFKEMQALAEYNLGLVALKQNDKKNAIRWFKSASTYKNKKITQLSNTQLSRLRQKTARQWYNMASLTLGHNNNISSAPDEVATKESGNYMDLYASTNGVLSGTYDDGIRLKGSFLYQDFFNTNTYDYTQFNIGLYKHFKLDEWKTALGGYFERSTYADTSYLQILGLVGTGKYKTSNTDTIYLRYRYNDISSSLENQYNYLEGWRQQFQIALWQYTKDHSSSLSYELELNDRTDTSTRSYSPTRHSINGSYRYFIDKQWHLGLHASYRNSDYPVKPTQNREDDRYRAAVDLLYKIEKNWKVKLKYQYTDNNSTDNNYEYTQDLYYISTDYSF
ncbi:MAG: tetratricopeptide repeat protein [Gammaproteobacteria bacterium]|nr:tetratricopeptide repeat protein [Gammaproteobacteria bacterium]